MQAKWIGYKLTLSLLALAAVPLLMTPLAPPADGARGLAAPDLVVSKITFETVASQIRVLVENEGSTASASCYLALRSLVGSDASLPTKQRVWSIQIPALEAGKGYSIAIDVAPLGQSNGPWQATIDRSNVVAESNEANNSLTYPKANPGPALQADLVIDNFQLLDPEHGDVKVIVANKGQFASKACSLRLIVWEPGKFEQKEAKTIFVKVGALQAAQTVIVMARPGVPIINTRYSMYIDIGNDVTESNEENNRAEGEAGNFKP